MKEFWRKWKQTIIGIVVGAIFALISSLYFYRQTISKPEPVLYIDPVRSKLVEKDKLSETTIRVTRLDGTTINDDVNLIKLRFQNKGRKTISMDMVIEPIIINFNDSTCEILDLKIDKPSRPRVKSKLTDGSGLIRLFQDGKPYQQALNFRALEENDFVAGSIIYAGNNNVNVEISGIIQEAEKIIVEDDYLQNDWSDSYFGISRDAPWWIGMIFGFGFVPTVIFILFLLITSFNIILFGVSEVFKRAFRKIS